MINSKGLFGNKGITKRHLGFFRTLPKTCHEKLPFQNLPKAHLVYGSTFSELPIENLIVATRGE